MTPSGPGDARSAIWPRPVVWVWLIVNLAWLQIVVPFWIVSTNLVVLEPGAGWQAWVLAAAIMILVIPLVGVIGFALGSYWGLLRLEQLVARKSET